MGQFKSVAAGISGSLTMWPLIFQKVAWACSHGGLRVPSSKREQAPGPSSFQASACITLLRIYWLKEVIKPNLDLWGRNRFHILMILAKNGGLVHLCF